MLNRTHCTPYSMHINFQLGARASSIFNRFAHFSLFQRSAFTCSLDFFSVWKCFSNLKKNSIECEMNNERETKIKISRWRWWKSHTHAQRSMYRECNNIIGYGKDYQYHESCMREYCLFSKNKDVKIIKFTFIRINKHIQVLTKQQAFSSQDRGIHFHGFSSLTGLMAIRRTE